MKRTICFLLIVWSAGCRQLPTPDSSPPEPESRTETITNWTAQTELFVEFPPLVEGQVSRFAVHLTRLDRFKPLTEGRVEVHLTDAAGKATAFSTDAPSRPGIFGLDVTPPRPGGYQLTIHLEGEGIVDVHELGNAHVSAPGAVPAQTEEDPGQETIPFLKEQQWILDFGTAVIEERRLQASLRVPGRVMPRSGGEAEVAAPFDGLFLASDLPAIGANVTQGQALASILPLTNVPSDLALLELARQEATLALQLAQQDHERARRLVAAGAVPARRLEEAQVGEAVAAARLKAAQTRLEQYETSSAAVAGAPGALPFAVRAPISGTLAEIRTVPGAQVHAGDVLLKIIDLRSLYVSAAVPEAELPRMRNLSGAELEMPGSNNLRRLGRPVTVGPAVDPISRTFPVVYALDNGDGGFALNQAVGLYLFTTAGASTPAVPETAIVEDAGQPVVFVQVEGEAFLRKPVRLGNRQGGYVQVLEGVVAGRRVVTRGAQLIRLAAMSDQVPAHGHVH